MNVISVTPIVNQVSLNDLEREMRRSARPKVPRATAKEVGVALILSAFLAPFFFTTFFVLPIMGQIAVGLALFITGIYLWARRSIAITLAALVGSGSFALLTYFTIQAVKAKLDVPLFIFLVLGIPITAIFCLFLTMQIWALRGGEQ